MSSIDEQERLLRGRMELLGTDYEQLVFPGDTVPCLRGKDRFDVGRASNLARADLAPGVGGVRGGHVVREDVAWASVEHGCAKQKQSRQESAQRSAAEASVGGPALGIDPHRLNREDQRGVFQAAMLRQCVRKYPGPTRSW